MTSHRKLERDLIYADMAAVTALLNQLDTEDVMSRFSLEARRDELRDMIGSFAGEPEDTAASAILFFGGRPVNGTHGIESEFAGAAVSKFQDLIAKVMAQEVGALGQRGVVPHKSASTLHITNVARGSFGFVLEEVQTQTQLVDTPLKSAVDEAVQLLDAFGEPDETHFQAAIETIDQRVLATAREFFDLMRQGGATLRLVAGMSDHSFGAEAVNRAAERATSTTVEDAEENVQGQLAGVLPEAHQFEFRVSDDRGVVRGKVDRALASHTLAKFNRDMVNVDAQAQLQVKRVLRNGVVARESYTLVGLARAGED
jgi:hypothetical protein